MTAEWKPGTIAVLDLAYDDLVPRVSRTLDGKWRSVEDDRFWEDEDVSYVHQMAVINPAAVEAKRPGLASILAGHAHRVVERDGMSHSGDTTDSIDQLLTHLELPLGVDR